MVDAGGLSASFQAWKIRAKEEPNAHLPELDYFTHDVFELVMRKDPSWHGCQPHLHGPARSKAV
jgi:hypothetical protein